MTPKEFRTKEENGAVIKSSINPDAIVMFHEKTKDGETTYTVVLMDGSVLTLTAEEFEKISSQF